MIIVPTPFCCAPTPFCPDVVWSVLAIFLSLTIENPNNQTKLQHLEQRSERKMTSMVHWIKKKTEKHFLISTMQHSLTFNYQQT